MKDLKLNVSRGIGKLRLSANQHAPELWLAGGLLSGAVALFATYRATIKVQGILQEHRTVMENIAEVKELRDKGELLVTPPTDEEIDADVRNQMIKTGVRIAKEAAIPIGLEALSVTCLLTSRNILNKRYLGAVAAYNVATEALERYRARVKDEYGEGLDRHFMYGTTYSEDVIETVDENGKKKKEKVKVAEAGDKKHIASQYAVFFDESNPHWDPNPNFTKTFLKTQQLMFNDRLRARGYVFLNEVRESLGFEGTPDGQLVGWLRQRDDDFVDFGLDSPENQNTRKFVNGQASAVLLDFNVDGIIYDKIQSIRRH